MDDCIFCKIIKKEIPSETVYEDADFLAFLDIHPQSAGHVQIIPKEHYRWVWDVPNVGAYFEIAKKLALAQRQAFGTEAIWSKVMGDEVHHAHVWVFPNPKETLEARPTDFKTNAEKLRSFL